MDGSFSASFWEGRVFWFTLALPSIVWLLAFGMMIFSNYQKRALIWIFSITTFALIIASNAIRRIAVDLVRNNQLDLLDFLNDILENGQAILILMALTIAFFNIHLRAIWPLICALLIQSIIHYTLWFTTLFAYYI